MGVCREAPERFALGQPHGPSSAMTWLAAHRAPTATLCSWRCLLRERPPIVIDGLMPYLHRARVRLLTRVVPDAAARP